MSDDSKNTGTESEAKSEEKAPVAKKSGGKAKADPSQEGPWIYVGENDIRKQLKKKTAYLQIPEGMDKALFVHLNDYPAWEKEQKEAGK